MKRYLYIVFVILVGLMSSCSNGEMDKDTYPTTMTILKVTADEGLQTRANATGVDRFAIEVYTDATYTTPANEVFGSTNKASNTTGEFTMILDRTQAYYCLIWADKAGASVYNITSLKEVALTGKAVEAWQGTKTIAAGTAATLGVSLTRAVSKISLMETGKLKSGSTLKLNFSQPTKFNVVDGTTSTLAARTGESISIAADVDGTTTPAKLNTADIFVLSSVATANLTDLTFQFDSETAFTVSQAPLKANYNTNIKGHYTSSSNGVTFTVTTEGDWGGSDNVVNFPVKTYAIGDLYPDAINPVGVVCAISNRGAHGKVISLDEGKNMAWSLKSKLLNVVDADGAVNMAKIQAEESWGTNYPAFKWCDDLTPVGEKKWYLPSQEELMVITRPILTVLNNSILSAGHTDIVGYYQTSTEKDINDYYYVTLDTENNTSPYAMNTPKIGAYDELKFRALLAF